MRIQVTGGCPYIFGGDGPTWMAPFDARLEQHEVVTEAMLVETEDTEGCREEAAPQAAQDAAEDGRRSSPGDCKDSDRRWAGTGC